MANTHVFETKMSDRMQVTRFSVPVWAAQASFEERSKLTKGQAVTRPYTSFSRADMDYYTRGTDMTPISVDETNETLTVNLVPSAALPIDDFDELQSNFALQATYAKKMMRAVNSMIDLDYLAEVANASSYVDAGDVGGSAGSPVTLTTNNVIAVYAAALRKLQENNVEIAGIGDPRPDMTSIKKGNMKPMGSSGFANLSPYFNSILIQAIGGRATEMGDLVGKNGYVNTYYSFDNFVTTNSYWEGILSMATNVTADDTVTIGGVVFTFKASPASAGEVDIGGSVDVTRANLAAAINGGAGAGTAYIELSAADRKALKFFTATNNNTADTLTVVAKGADYVQVSETLTDGTDAWTKEQQHLLFGQKGAVDMVVQKNIGVKVSDIPLQHGVYVKPYALFGKKTFSEGADALVDVRINTASL